VPRLGHGTEEGDVSTYACGFGVESCPGIEHQCREPAPALTVEALASALPEGGYLTITHDEDHGFIIHGSELAVFHPGAPTVQEAVAIAVPRGADPGGWA